MGCYVNPPNETKESFLEREGVKVSKISWDDAKDGILPVVLMDNGPFTAAGVCYSKRELEAFTDSHDYRPKKYYLVEIEKLLPVTDLLKEYLNNG